MKRWYRKLTGYKYQVIDGRRRMVSVGRKG